MSRPKAAGFHTVTLSTLGRSNESMEAWRVIRVMSVIAVLRMSRPVGHGAAAGLSVAETNYGPPWRGANPARAPPPRPKPACSAECAARPAAPRPRRPAHPLSAPERHRLNLGLSGAQDRPGALPAV